MILLLLLTLSISSLFGLPATFGNPPSDPACDALRTVADSLTGARIYGSLCADSTPKTGCTTASLELLKKCLDGIHVDQDCLDRMHTNLTEGSMDDLDCFCGGLVKFSEMLTSVGVLLCLGEDEVRDGMGNFLRYRKPSTKPSTTSSSTSTFKKSRSATGDLEFVPYETTNYEKRLYPPAKYVCTTSTYENPKAQGGKSPMEEVTEAEKMFFKLFAYIEGSNNKNQKIEMTAPVFTSMSVEEDNDHMVTKTMCFFIPKKLQGNPPAPNDQDVFILEMPEASLFVKTFIYDSNIITDSVWIKEKESFMHEMQVMGVDNKVSKNHFLTATYDIGLSKHEVMLEEITREKKTYPGAANPGAANPGAYPRPANPGAAPGLPYGTDMVPPASPGDEYYRYGFGTDITMVPPPPSGDEYYGYGTDMVPPAPVCDPVIIGREAEDWLPIIDCREDLNLAVTPPDASSVDWRTAKFDPSNYNQLWRQDSDGRIINKANGKVLVMDLYGFRFEESDSYFRWSFNTYIRSSQEPSGPISQKLQAKSDQDERCLNTADRIDTTGSVLMLYPCQTIHPINGCFKFK